MICYLCGSAIEHDIIDEQMELSMDHVPPKQFFPKEIRIDENLNLEKVPSHKKCNNEYKDDEDYFYHSLYPLVANSNPDIAQVIFKDFARRSNNPQTPALIRKIFSDASRITEGGIILPANMVVINLDLYKIQRIAGKIARGVLFLSSKTFFPVSSIVDMRICEKESEVPEMYQLSWKVRPIKGSYPKVFSYRYFPFNEYHIISLLFWEAFMFCVTIKDK
ncbi:MAG: hypothetical protein JW837_12250 [Sedimentisphaerales bacterium]|nr:hypothetical protein [Sedimentisphaerales bacterium]